MWSYNQLYLIDLNGVYHSFEENKLIRLTPWDKKVKSTKINQKTKEAYDSEVVVPAFGLSITRNGNQNFKIPLGQEKLKLLKFYAKLFWLNYA